MCRAEAVERRRKKEEANDLRLGVVVSVVAGVTGFMPKGLNRRNFIDLWSDFRAFSVAFGRAKVAR